MADIKSLIDKFNIFRTKDSILNDVAKDNGQITIDIKQPFSDDIDSNNSLKTKLETNIKDKLFNTEINNVGSNMFDEKIKPFDKGYNVSNTPDTDTKTPIDTTPIKPDTPTIEKNTADATAIQQEKTQQPEITTPKPKQTQQYKTITEQQNTKLTTDSLGNPMPTNLPKKGTGWSGVGQQQIDDVFNLIKNDEEKFDMFQNYLSEAYNQLKSANLNNDENIIYVPFSYDHENGNMQGITLRFGLGQKAWAEKQLKILEKGITDKKNEEWLSNLELPQPETTMDKITSNPWGKLLSFMQPPTDGMDTESKRILESGQKENRLNAIKWGLIENINECKDILAKYYKDKSQVGTALSQKNIAETINNVIFPQIDLVKQSEIASIISKYKKNPKSLTPIENEIVKYYSDYVNALSVVANKTSTGYETVKAIETSLPFMADFLRFNLVGSATRGGTRAAMKIGGKGLARQIAKGAPKTIGARAFKLGEDILTAAGHTSVSPLTFTNMLEDYSQTMETNGQYTKNDLRRGVIEAFTENFSERIFGALKGIMPKSNNAFVKALFGNNPVIKTMQKHMNVGGMFEETAEEYAGDFIKTMFGFALGDEKLAKSFKEGLDNSATTILSIGITVGLPQAIGMGIDFREIRNTNKRFNVAENNLKQYFNKENSYLDINRYSDALKSLYINLNNAKNEEDKAEIKGKIAELNKTAANLAMEKGDSNGFNLISEYSIAAQNSFYVTNKAMSELKDMSEEDRTKLSDNAINKLKNDFTNNLNWSLISRAAAKNITDQNGKQHPTCFLYTDNGVTYVLNGQKDNMFYFVDVNGNTISKSADELRNNENLSVLHLNNLLSSFSNKELEDINSKFIDIAQYNAGYRYKVNDNGEIRYYTDNKDLINSNTPYEQINRDKIESDLVGSYDLVRIDNITNAVEDMANAFAEPAAEQTSAEQTYDEQQPAQETSQETAQETIEQPAEEPIQEQPQEQTTEEQETTEQEPIQPTQQQIEPTQQEQPVQEEDDSTALNGVPDIVDDTPQDARERGFRRVNGYKIDRQKPLQAVNGKEIAVRFSNDVIANGHVAVIDAEQLQPSHIQGVRNPLHFIDEAQPKERNDEASIVSAQRIAKNIRPEEITSSVTAYTGAPIINARGETIQGNNRSDALRLMWSQNKDQAEKYKQYLIDHAQEFGLKAEDIVAMERPILVNMIDVSDEDAIALGQYVAQDTESGGLERIKPKNAVQKMGADMRTFANLLLSSNDDEISFAGLIDKNGVDVLNWLGQKGYITPTQYKSAFDTKGYITAEAKNDLRGIMYQSIFQGGSTRLEEMFNTMPAKAQKAILATAFRDYDSPKSESMIVEIQNSIRAYYALSQSADFMNAKTYKDVRLAVEGWKKQYQIDDATGESYLPAENFSNFALLLAAMYKGEKQTLIQGTFNKLYDLIQGTQEADLFETPDNTPRTLSQAIKEVLNIDYNGQQRSNVLVGDTATSQRGEQGSTRDAATRERTEDGERTADSAGSIEAESRVAQNEQENTKSQGKKPNETTKIEKIEDVGEKIGGSRKDAASEYKRRAEEDLAKPTSELEEFIANTTVSKIFNFDLKKLREQGISNEVVSFIKIAKQSIPPKPRNAYKRKIWVSRALSIYQMCLYANTKWDRIKEVLEKDGGIIKDIYQAYMSVGGFDGGLELNGAALHQLGKEASAYRNGKRISLDGKWRLENAGFYDDVYDTKEEAIDALKKFAGKNAVKPKSKQIEFAVYQRRSDNTLFITPKCKSNIIIQDGFKSSKEAFDYIKEHQSEMEERYKTLMSYSNAEFGENRERKGRDYRGGKDISAQEFMETFGFRGVEFGNWTNQKDRQVAINNAYDAFMDLAEVLGVSPKALSLNGKLGMAFGARGRGKFNAHYERDKVVINLTKTKGAGSLAHEWFHALDHYFATLGKADSMEFATNLHLLPKGVYRYIDKQGNYKYHNSRGDELSEEEVIKAFEANGVRREMVEAWYYLMDNIRKSDYYKRSEKYSILHTNYWIDPTELGARAFSKWVENELSKRNATNDYLANNPALFVDKVGEIGREYTPYPFDTDAEWIEDAFGNLFQTMEQKTDEETGNVILYQKSDGTIGVLSTEEAALRDALIDKLREAGIDVITNVEEAQRLLDEANSDEFIDTTGLAEAQEVNSNDIREQKVYHGSGADFDAFDFSHMGEGTGNKAFGWGGYVSESEGVGRMYVGEKAQLYLIEIPDDNGSNYLHFEKPIGGDMVRKVKDALYQYIVSNDEEETYSDNKSRYALKADIEVIDANAKGGDVYGTVSDFLGGDKQASEFLSSIGFVGISYNTGFRSGETTDNTRNYVIFNENDLKIVDKIRFFRTSDGNAYGFTVGGKIYIDPRIATADTPIHEYAHLWASAMQKLNPKEWANIVKLMKGTPIWEEVKRNYPELTTDNEIADEVLAFYSGSRGAERLREEHAKILKGNGNVVEKVKAINAIKRVREALKRFWKNVADWLGIHFTTAEEVADKVLSDLLNGVNPTLAGIEDDIRFEENSEEADIVARAKADGTYMKAPNGKQSNLSPRQWVQVRTKAFKDWFGDWENDPDNSSKVVDENGEPMVVYHGFIGRDFNIFDKDVAFDNSRSAQPVYGSFFFSDTRKQAEEYGSFFRKGERVFNGIKATFLNIKNPFILNSENTPYHSVRGYFKNRDTGEIDWNRGGIVKNGWEIGVQDITIAAKEEGYDGVIFRNIDDAGSEELVGTTHTTLAVFSPTQIKSATDNIGTFDQNNPDIRYRRASNKSVISSRFERQAEIQREEKNTKSAANIVLGNANVVLNDTDIFDEQYQNAIDNNLIDENVSPLIDSFSITWGYQLKNGVIVINKDVFVSDILDKRVKDNLSLLISSLMKTNKTFFKEGISFFKKLPIWVLYKNDTKSNEDTIKEIINDILLGNTSIDTNKLELLKQYTVQDMNDILDNATKWFEKFEGISSNMFAGNSISDILDTTLGDLMPKEITTTQEGKRLNWFSKLGIDIRSKLFDSLDWFRVVSDKTKDKTASELYDAMIVHTKRVQGKIDIFDKEYVRPIIDTIQSMLGKDFGNSTLSLDLIQEYFAIKSLLGRTASLYKEKFGEYLANPDGKKPPMFDEFKQIYDEITEDEIKQRINEMGEKSSMPILQKVDIDYLMEEVRRTLAAEMFVKQYVYSSANTLNQGLQGEQSLGLINEVTNEPYSELYQLLYSDEQSSQTMHSPIEIIEQADILIDRAGLRKEFDFIGNQIQAILNYVNIERFENGLMSSDTFAKRQLMKDFVNQRGENSSEGNLYEITAKQKANEKMKGKDWFNPNSITSIIAVAQTEIATMEKELLAQRLSYFLTNPNNFDVLSQYGMIIDEKETLNEELSEDDRNYINDKNIVLLYGDRHTDKNTKGQVDKKQIKILKRNDDGTFTKVTISFDNKFIGLEEFVKFVNNNFKYEELRGLSKAAAPIIAWFSRMYTILSPLFPTKNLFKDLMVTPWLPAKELNGKNSQYAIKNFYNAFNNLSFILKMSFTEKSFSKKGFENKLKARSQELFEYYLEYSKQHSIFSIEDQIGALSKENKTLQDIERALSGKENKFIKFTERALLIKFMQHYAEVFENLHKFSAYVTLRKLGYGEERSAQIANNATLNYDRSGSIGRQLNAIIPFAKAALGGLYRTNYLLPKYNPKGFLQRVITLAVLGVMQGLMYDPDDDDISEFARKSGMVFGSFLYPLLPEELSIVRPVRALVIVMAGKKSPAYFKQELMESTIDLVPIASDALRGAFSYNPLTNKTEFDVGQLFANTDKMTAVYALAMLASYINENKNSFGKNVLLNEETNTDKTRYGRTKQDYGLYDYLARLYNSILNGVDIDDRAAMSNKIGKNGERLMTIAKEDVEFVINNYIPFGRLYAYTAEIIYDAVNDKRINKGHIPLIGGLFAQKSFGKDYYLVNNIKYELKDFTNDFSQSQIEDIKTNILDKAGIREGIRYKALKDNPNANPRMLDIAKRNMNEAFNVFILDINNFVNDNGDKKTDFTENEYKFILKSFLDSPIMKKALSIGEDTLNKHTAKRIDRTYKRYDRYNNENIDADKENMKDAVKKFKNELYDKSITEEEFNNKLNSLWEPMTEQIKLRAKFAGYSIE